MIFLDEFSREYWMEFIAFRLGCCLFSSTWFVPDEYFQGIEVAYRMVFGQGHMAWEWSSKWALRSVLHPLLYALPFSALRFVGLDFAYLIRVTPQLLHAVIFATADMCYLKWLKKLGLSHKIFDLTISLYFSNWFLLYCCTRTLSNTVECALSLVALNWYEQGKRDKKPAGSSQPPGQSYGICIVCVAFATVIRPTAALLWATLLLLHFWENSRTADGRLSLRLMGIYICKYAPYVLGIFFLAFSLDSLFYGRSIFCLWNFLRFNVLGGGSALFGVHPWHWYITQGLPPTLGITCIPLLTSMVNFRSFRIPKRYAGAACIYMIVHSVISHKEHRFILPVISFILPYVAFELSRYRYSRILKYLLLIQNAALIIYFGLIHQRGPYAASNKLLGFIESQPKSVNITILQLMPCFSMPMIAALHPHANRTRIKMLDCGLSLESINEKQKHASKQQETSTNTKIFGDEADEFHVNPIEWLNREWYAEQLYQNELIVAFEHTYSRIEHFLISKGYRRYASVFHTFFPISSRQSTNIVISYKANSLL